MPPKQSNPPNSDHTSPEVSSQLLGAINSAMETQVAPLREEMKALKEVGSRIDNLESMLSQFLLSKADKPATVPHSPPNTPVKPTTSHAKTGDKGPTASTIPILDTPPQFRAKQPLPFDYMKGGYETRWSEATSQGYKCNLPRLEFPSFDGSDILTWIEDGEFYFDVYQTPEIYKTRLAVTHFVGEAREWYRGFKLHNPDPPWPVLIEEVKARFTNDGVGNPLEQFRKVVHLGKVDEYIRNFEKVKSRLTTTTKILNEEFYLFGFLSGLKEELKYTVEMCEPLTLNQAYKVARQAELSLGSLEKKGRSMLRPTTNFVQRNDKGKELPDRKTLAFPMTKTTGLPPANFNSLSREQLRQMGLCYYCGDKFHQGHKCQKRKILLLEASSSLADSEEEEVMLPDNIDNDDAQYEQADISLCMPQEQPNTQYLRFKGYVNTTPIIALIDSGSTHSFIHPSIVKLLQLTPISSPPMIVKTANGSKLLSDKRCDALKFQLQAHEFVGDFRVLEVQGYDLVLGMDWIARMGPVVIDVFKGLVQLTKEGKKIQLQVKKEMAEVTLLTSNVNVTQELQKGSEVIFAQLFITQVGTSSSSPLKQQLNIPLELQSVLSKFSSVFADPITLPPHRVLDHQIPLKHGAEPVNLRPYRFSHFQKLEIEKIVEELLQTGYIRPSTSPFASPILLVKKKDQTWRLCVDYRKLNEATIKNKFPIPIIDDLLDELKGASIFSKLDLKSGYHQIRMHDSDIPKTAFRTHLGHYEFTVMPFGLTNAPATFQALMNSIFKPHLRKFILVFFDDILVYSKSMSDHKQHLAVALNLLQEHHLFVKLSKCEIGTPQVEYLGHIISEEGVATDPSKVEAMVSWPVPKTVRQLRGFLGLTGYYRKFVQHYGVISRPLTDLLKKDSFKWNDQAQLAFDNLKSAMTKAPVLSLPDFSKPFVLETDASQTGIGAVLMQERKPLAFLSKGLGIKNQSLSTYEKELLAVVTAVNKWRHYLVGGPFIIRTDHISLKNLLEQRIHTSMQHKSLGKLLGLHYTIEYKKGTHNLVADALSRREGFDENTQSSCSELCIVSELVPQWVLELQSSYTGDDWILQLRKQLAEGPNRNDLITEHQGLIRYKGRICVGKAEGWRDRLLHELHNSGLGGHSGILVTYKKVKSLFYWPSMKQHIMDHIRQCDICQITKPEHVATPGLLQPLPIPPEAWHSIGMDFITCLPKSEGKEVLLVVVDRLTKYGHFLPLAHPYTAATVAQTFLDNIYKLHGLPTNIVSDRDPIFTSKFWQEIMHRLGIQLNMSTAYHPQSDGQVERVNQCVEAYLRSMVFHQQKKWVRWIPLAEYWYNTNFHSSLNTTPFKALYGYDPPSLPMGSIPRCNVESVNVVLKERQQILSELRSQLIKAQERMKRQDDSQRSERQFHKGDWVYLKLQPYRQLSVSGASTSKLNPKFYGPYEILRKVGTVAYELNLPPHSSIHPVLHVSQLKARIGTGQTVLPNLPIVGLSQPEQTEPEAILNRRLIKRRNDPVPQILVKWANQAVEEATWEDYDSMKFRFPHINLEDKVVLEEEGMSRPEKEIPSQITERGGS
ncbi:polyprotein [Rhynchospora pubera]|uniref:Polyprotein n=1 Tax=Rhynchospora pubera TaxID=906938 RepID=A0AAV8GVL0_9POAL|nr:polyprotein [Rhynchospora pubera]